MAGVGRRQIITLGAAGLGLTLLAPGRARAGEQADVVVAGGGLAGLYAGITLADAGLRVVVLEAGQRPGGRVYTDYKLPGKPDLGAVEVGPLYARVRDLARRLDLALEPRGNPVGGFALAVNGELVSIPDWPDSPLNKTEGPERRVPPPALLQSAVTNRNPLQRPGDWLRGDGAAPDISVHDWLQSIGVSAEAQRLVNAGLIVADSRETSVLPTLQDGLRMRLARGVGGDRASGGVDSFVGGTSRLTTAMAELLGDRLRLNKRVSAVTMDASGAETVCDDGSAYRSRFVIAAMPFPALRRIAVKPGFSGAQAEAINTMRWANTSQVFLRQLAGNYWEQDGFEPSLWTDGPVNLYRQVLNSDRILAVLVGRKADALDRLGPAERGAFVVRDLESLRPALRGKLEVIATHSWRLEPDIRGCRHDFRPGTVRQFVPAMFAPHARMHFAGEHTRRLEIGMESALESGERAALEILSA